MAGKDVRRNLLKMARKEGRLYWEYRNDNTGNPWPLIAKTRRKAFREAAQIAMESSPAAQPGEPDIVALALGRYAAIITGSEIIPQDREISAKVSRALDGAQPGEIPPQAEALERAESLVKHLIQQNKILEKECMDLFLQLQRDVSKEVERMVRRLGLAPVPAEVQGPETVCEWRPIGTGGWGSDCFFRSHDVPKICYKCSLPVRVVPAPAGGKGENHGG